MDDEASRSRDLAVQRLSRLLSGEHWLGNFITDVLNAHELTGGSGFAEIEQLLATAKQEFAKDLAIARRMYQLYPRLVAGESQAETGLRPSVLLNYSASL